MQSRNRRRFLAAAALGVGTSGTVLSAGKRGEDSVSQRERVRGIGGFFFRSRDPKMLAEWYQRHLGIDPVPQDYQHRPWQQSAGPTIFNPFPMETEYFGSADRPWLMNFRVRNLDAFVQQLSKEGNEVKVDPATYPNGRFGRLHDPEGNPIELWEPARP